MKLMVGVPAFNAENYIESALKSLINQTYIDWKAIIINDGSSDRTMEVVSSVVSGDERFAVLDDGKNLGLATRLNQIAEHTDTLWLARMDADDIMHPERLRRQLDHLETHPELDVLGSAAYIIDTDGAVSGVRHGARRFDTYQAIQGPLFVHPTIMGKAEWFRRNPYSVSRRRSEDYDLWLSGVKNSHFANMQDPLLYYREVGLSHGAKYDATMREIEQLLREHPLASDAVFRDAIQDKIKDVKNKRRIFQILSYLGLDQVLVRRRSRALTPAQEAEAARALRQALTGML